ncbi:MAG: sigma 54-interacting transcriptional regulator [Acidobacteria bacterium]|nr:sigma 54-interacting transcriptional regulator [Acidobacteriota bacterium]
MELVADRFARLRGGRIVDLATARMVTLRAAPAGAAADQLAWDARCAALMPLRHPYLQELLDYGFIGRHVRFEATAVDQALSRHARPGLAAQALASAATFLNAVGVTAGSCSPRRLVAVGKQLFLRLDASTGLPLPPGADDPFWAGFARCRTSRRPLPSPRHVVGLRLVRRSELEPIVEMLDNAIGGDVHHLHLAGEAGSGITTAMSLLAREARVRGYIPVCPTSLGKWSDLGRLLSGRAVMLFVDDSSGGATHADLASITVNLALHNSRPLVVLSGGPTVLGAATRIDLRPLSREQLIAAVPRFGSDDDEAANHVAAAALEAQGSPGLFVRLLSGEALVSTSTHRRRIDRVAEMAGDYAAADPDPVALIATADTGTLRAVGRAAKGMALAAAGRHGPAERLLRAAAAALARRYQWARAADTCLRLGALLRERGRIQDALEIFECARGHGQRGARPDIVIRAGIWIGIAQTDAGRLAEAESVLRAASMAAEHVNGCALGIAARLALARCLFWQARFEDASSALEGDDHRGEDRVRALRLMARLALRRGDVEAAGSCANEATCRAADCADRRELAGAHDAMAAVEAAIGNLEGLRHHVRLGMALAREAHAPLRAWRIRLTFIEGLHAAGDKSQARALAVRLRRQSIASLPPLLRGRAELAMRAVGAAEDERAGDARWSPASFVRVSGAKALELQPAHPPDVAMVQEVVEVLRICHETDDDRTALARVCAAVRERLGAAGVCLCGDEPYARSLAVAGPVHATPSLAARRALETGLMIPPARTSDALEAAAPVRYGGTTIAALACRWLIDAPVNPGRTTALLTGAAAACAPAVRTVIDRLAVPDGATAFERLELLGASPGMEELRRAIRRAADAPFSILIVGESGSGKELVARAIHRLGARRDRRFCAVNCAALTEDLLEAELFGHTRGAFTGALTERIGLFEEADGGVLFLDEIGELSARAQAKILRALQEGEIRRVGENFARRVDVRVVAATNRTLADEAAAGRFRQDLLYRLDVIRLEVPPLRERIEDVRMLAAHFWTRSIERTGSRATLDPAVFPMLARYDWPGNVRELQNVLAALAVHAPRRGRVGPVALPRTIASATLAASGHTLAEAREVFEQRFVRAALARAGGHRGRAAAALGMSRQGLAKLLARLKLDPAAG